MRFSLMVRPFAPSPFRSRSPSFNMHSNLNDWLTNGSHGAHDPRPDSATSSVMSRDSGVARSDPKSSRDFSAKSEASSKASHTNNRKSPAEVATRLAESRCCLQYATDCRRYHLPILSNVCSSSTNPRLSRSRSRQPSTPTLSRFARSFSR